MNQTFSLYGDHFCLFQDREKQEQLNEVLAGYSANGLPGLPDLMRIPGQPVYPTELFELEAHWSSLVTNASVR